MHIHNASNSARRDGGQPDLIHADLEAQGRPVIGRRSFLRNTDIAGAAAVGGSAPFAGAARAASDGITAGDAAILRFLAAAELIEADLWPQYDELGGVNGGNPTYQAALTNIDPDMPTYIHLNNEDEQSHAAFLNTFLTSKGGAPVNLDPSRTLPSSRATGAKNTRRLTSLTSLNVDTSWYTRYRSSKSPDFGATFPQAITIRNQPAIPVTDADTPPNINVPAPAKTPAQKRIQVIACTAAFHFAFIEQGGMSLYATLGDQVTGGEVLRVVTSISGTENQHFATWQDDAGNSAATPIAPVTDPVSGLTSPKLNARTDKTLFATNRIFPHPTEFTDKRLPLCSVVRPTDPRLGGAVAFANALIADRLFEGQTPAFFATFMQMAQQADAARRS